MDKNHILPPLVHGRLRGFLNFFVDEIKIYKNICGSEECEIIVEVQWWGDPSPALIRPKTLYLCKKEMKHVNQKAYYHSAKYELKTDCSLFQNYLNACEVLELTVLEVFSNNIIGSAFLKNLIKIIWQSNDQLIFPIVDCLGETIGEMKIHTDFIAKNPETCNNFKINNENNFEESSFVQKKKQKSFQKEMCDKIQEDSLSQQSLELFQNYNGDNLNDWLDCFKSNTNCFTIGQSKMNFKNKEIQESSNICFLKNSSTSKSTENHYQSISKESDHNLPKVEVYSDCSKVLSFSLKKGSDKCDSSKMKPKFAIKKFSNKKKRNQNNTLGKSIIEPLSNKSLNLNSDKKLLGENKQISNNESQICKKIEESGEEKLHQKPNHLSLCSPRVSPISLPSSLISNNSISPIAKVLYEKEKKKVLDYLLGFDMNKEEEYIALNDFKKMSPCENFVETINELFERYENSRLVMDPSVLEKENESEMIKKTVKTFKSFKFDFNNPIEKKYFETFFSDAKSAIDLELAEILNQLKKTPVLKREECQEDTPTVKDTNRKEEQTKKTHENMEPLNLIRVTGTKEFSSSNSKSSGISYEEHLNDIKKTNHCEKCKYYKKLNELDTIIESLKNFEKNILNTQKKETF